MNEFEIDYDKSFYDAVAEECMLPGLNNDQMADAYTARLDACLSWDAKGPTVPPYDSEIKNVAWYLTQKQIFNTPVDAHAA